MEIMMKKSVAAFLLALFITIPAYAGIQPKFESFMKRHAEVTSLLEKKKSSLKPADYNKFSNEIEASRQKMYQGAGTMQRTDYYTFGDAELKKLDQIEQKIK